MEDGKQGQDNEGNEDQNQPVEQSSEVVAQNDENENTEQEVIKKKWTKEDILSAEDESGVATAYFEAAKNDYVNLAELQVAAGERLNQLGNTELAMKFAILAGETENARTLKNTAEHNAANSRSISMASHRMTDAAALNEGAANTMNEVSDKMTRPAQMMDNVVDEMSRVVKGLQSSIENSFENSARSLSSTADKINEASRRMNNNY